MIVYTNTINEFNNDVVSGLIATKIQDKLIDSGYSHSSDSEFRSWENSLLHMQMVLNDNSVNQELHVAIEYNIPNTSKRVDFIVSGLDEHDKPKVVIVEIKKKEKTKKKSKEDLVTTFIGGNIRPVTHPSYQAYSYAKTIESFNETVYKNNIKLIPSAFLHNYKEEYRKELDNYLYQDIVKVAPLFLQRDKLKLRDFITKNVKKSDQGKLLYQIDNGKIKPSKSLQDAISSMLEGNKEFYMIDEQKVAFSTVKKLVENAFKTDDKYTVIIEGGPGTGKSVIAINLLAEFKNRLVNYVTKNAAPRNVFFEKLKREKYKLNYINNLFKGSGAYVNTKKNEYDLLIVDEAHRLNERSGLFAHRGENQIKEIINAAKVSVFFIDEDQKVTTKDFGSVEEIKKQAKLLNSQLFYGEDYQLVSQFRCNGSDGYLAFLDDVLGIRKTANYDGFEMDYDIKVFDDLILMKENLKKLNEINNKTRMVAGYTYDWVTKKNPNVDEYDIVLGEFKAKWNFSNTKTWAIDESSFDEVGCIHTSQGLEFDYIGVIIGKDLIYRNNKVITDFTKRAKTDYSLRGIKTNENYQLADTIIRNTYKTLMSRGQKGCYVYCEDKELSNYLRKRIHGNQ